MMEEDEVLLEKNKSNSDLLERKERFTKKRVEMAAREIVKDKERQLIYK